MPITSIGAFVKIILGTIIGYILFNYVNILDHQALGVGFGFLSVFLIVRGMSYFVFLTLRRITSTHPNELIISASYRLSLMLGVYVLCNIALMLVDKWTLLLGVLMAVLFLIVQYSATVEVRKKAAKQE